MENDNEDLIQINDKIYILTWTVDTPNKDIRFRVKNSMNQTVEVNIWSYYSDYDNYIEYEAISLSVNKKSKGYEFGKITGKSGIESLLLAKEILKYYINHFILSRNRKNWTYYLAIWWDDNRRRDVYYRGLKDLEFNFFQRGMKNYNSGKCLVRKFDRIDEFNK